MGAHGIYFDGFWRKGLYLPDQIDSPNHVTLWDASNLKNGILSAATGIRFAKVAHSHGVSIFPTSVEMPSTLPMRLPCGGPFTLDDPMS